MSIEFCPGYSEEPVLSLVRDYPGEAVYPAADFRVEWGPIFHRGRLDGSARILAIGQDPAQHEAVARRILVGTAGKRVQGFLQKVGLTRSYVLVNTFLYSVYGQGNGSGHIADPAITAYRNAWFKDLLDLTGIQAVVAFGGLADESWQRWLTSADAQGRPPLPYQHVPHPTSPEGAGGTAAQKKAATKAMLLKYNSTIAALRPLVTGDAPPAALYGDTFVDADLPDVPMADLPGGTPPWMSTEEAWAARSGTTAALKRRTIKITVPDSVVL